MREIEILNTHISIQEKDCAYVSPYSLFMIENFPLNFTNNTRLCDYGSGTGILGIIASYYGVSNISSIDINDECLELTKINYENNTKSLNLSFYKTDSDCNQIFDTIICNPASLPNFILGNSFCDGGVLGIDMILQVLEFAKKNLTENGKLYIIITSILPFSLIKEKMQGLALTYKIVAKKVIPFREHYSGISDWVDKNKANFPEMHYIIRDEKIHEELLLFEIARR